MRRMLLAASALALWSTNAAAANIVQNGDFSQNYANFTSDYTKVATNGTVFTTPPGYGVISNASTAFTNGYLSYGDHTTGSGQMLFFDGAGSGLDIWRQTETLAANTNYIFSYFASTPDGGSLSGNDFTDLQVKLNGTGLGDTVIKGQGGSGWQLVSTSFKTTTAGSYTLAISDLNGTAFQNDGLIDDIDLEAVVAGIPGAAPEPATWAMMITGFGVVGYGLRRRRKVNPQASYAA